MSKWKEQDTAATRLKAKVILERLQALERRSATYWTEARTLKLIKLYKAKPALWSHPDLYNSPAQKDAAWAEIAKTFHKTSQECKSKMQILKSSLRREKAKLVHSNGTYKSSWFAFDAMRFLLDKNFKRYKLPENFRGVDSNINNSNMDNSINNSNINSDINNSNIIIDSNGNSLSKEFENYVVKINDITSGNEDDNEYQIVNEIIDEAIIPKTEPCDQDSFSNTNESTTENQDKNYSSMDTPATSEPEFNINNVTYVNDPETTSFLNFVGNKMVKYDVETRLAVQRAICDVMFQHDHMFYKKNRNDSLGRKKK